MTITGQLETFNPVTQQVEHFISSLEREFPHAMGKLMAHF